MSLIYVNYIYHASRDDYEIIDKGPVLATVKTAILDTEKIIRRPLVVPIDGQDTVVDRFEYEAVHKKFRLSVDDKGFVKEDPNGQYTSWLPKDTDVSKLRVLNGQLVMVEEEATEEEPKAEEPKEETKENKKTNKEKKSN